MSDAEQIKAERGRCRNRMEFKEINPDYDSEKVYSRCRNRMEFKGFTSRCVRLETDSRCRNRMEFKAGP